VTLAVDRTACGGVGLCEAMRPDLFRVAEDGIAEVRRADLRDPEQITAARGVRDCCPTEAVLLRGGAE
jgi:ferredoxin